MTRAYEKMDVESFNADRARRRNEAITAIGLMPDAELPDAMREACTTPPVNALYLRLLLDRGAEALERALRREEASA